MPGERPKKQKKDQKKKKKEEVLQIPRNRGLSTTQWPHADGSGLLRRSRVWGKDVGFAVDPKKKGGGEWKPVLQVGWFAYDRYDRWGACLLIGSKALVPKHQNTENKDS